MEYITNGSFEQIDSCYGDPAPIGFDVFAWTACKGWSNPIASSSDLWCQNPIFGSQTPPFIPGAGYQNPKTGNNMAGILINAGIVYNYREYIQNELSNNLKSGNKYDLTFYVSFNNIDCISTQFGVKFYNQPLHDLSTLWLTDEIPYAVNDDTQIVYDTINWQLVTIPFIATGNEKYVVIGNFEDSTKLSYTLPCDTSFWGNLKLAGGYFFIDDVSIKEAAATTPIIPTVFTPNYDGINDVWRCDLSEYNHVNTFIYNRWGNLVFKSSKNTIQWDGTTTSGNNCEDGIYFYCIETETEKYKGYIQLLR